MTTMGRPGRPTVGSRLRDGRGPGGASRCEDMSGSGWEGCQGEGGRVRCSLGGQNG